MKGLPGSLKKTLFASPWPLTKNIPVFRRFFKLPDNTFMPADFPNPEQNPFDLKSCYIHFVTPRQRHPERVFWREGSPEFRHCATFRRSLAALGMTYLAGKDTECLQKGGVSVWLLKNVEKQGCFSRAAMDGEKRFFKSQTDIPPFLPDLICAEYFVRSRFVRGCRHPY